MTDKISSVIAPFGDRDNKTGKFFGQF